VAEKALRGSTPPTEARTRIVAPCLPSSHRLRRSQGKTHLVQLPYASVSLEALQDFNTILSFVPNELFRAVIDAETDWLVNDHTNGILYAADTLGRDVGSDTPRDALQLAIDDLRVGPALATADLIALHPSTFSYLKRQKDSLGRVSVGA
jgi:hypothetical protein